jgi:hypothetical protein
MEDFFNQTDDYSLDEGVTPESLAWKLLMDDDVEKYTGVLLPFTDVNDKSNTSASFAKYDSLSVHFEILITMYMEMIFSMLKINHISKQCDENGELKNDVDFEQNIRHDFSQFTLDDMTILFREKLKKIRIFLSVIEITNDSEINNNETNDNEMNDNDNNNETKDKEKYTDYYCRVILKDTLEGRSYFWRKRNTIDPNKRYTFEIRNDTKKTHNKLEDFYAICSLPNIRVKISFSYINVISGNPHD